MKSTPKFPNRVTLEITNRCTRACEGCPRNKTNYPIGNMTEKLFTSIVSQLPSSTVIVPFFRGESTLHPQFPQFMRQLKGFKEVQLATNGDHLTAQVWKAIVDNCTFLSYSLHEFKYPSQTAILSFFYELLGAGVETQVSILENLVPPEQKEDFVKLWLMHVDKVRIYKQHSINGFGDMLNIPQPNSPCNKPFEDMVVYWDGKVGLCNHDWNNLVSLGDLNHESISQVWNNREYEKVREFHLKGDRQNVETCRECSFESKKVYGEILNG